MKDLFDTFFMSLKWVGEAAGVIWSQRSETILLGLGAVAEIVGILWSLWYPTSVTGAWFSGFGIGILAAALSYIRLKKN